MENKQTELHEIYTPIGDFIVVEFTVPQKTKGGIMLTDNAKEEYSKQMAWKVIAKGKDVKYTEIGDYVLIGPGARPMGIPLLRTQEDTTQHVQIHEYEILGKVDREFVMSQKAVKTVLH